LYPKTPVQQINGCCHIYHPRCLERWIDELTILECPLCRFRPEIFADPLTWDGRQYIEYELPVTNPSSRWRVITNLLFYKRVFYCLFLIFYVSCFIFVCDVILSSRIQSQYTYKENASCGSHIYSLLYQEQCPVRNATYGVCFVFY
jgi:hypothetical protein